ncbi:MAG: GNAT family N-acetyltransferase [Phycisphaerae bacterium]
MNRSDRTIRTANEGDLADIWTLLKDILFLDRFSQDLIREKVFVNPAPERMKYEMIVSEAGGGIVGVMQVVRRPADRKGWIGLFGVQASQQRTGIASELLDHALGMLKEQGVEEVEVLAIPGNYFTPGVDPRYTSALCFLEKRGFQRFRDCVNMIGRLDEAFDVSGDIKRLEDAGLTIRRATVADGPLLDAYFSLEFGDDWRLEAALAMANDPPGASSGVERRGRHRLQPPTRLRTASGASSVRWAPRRRPADLGLGGYCFSFASTIFAMPGTSQPSSPGLARFRSIRTMPAVPSSGFSGGIGVT